MPGRPQPSLIGDTHRIANALEALTELYILDLINQIAVSPIRYGANLDERLSGIVNRWKETRAAFYDPRVPSAKAEDDDGGQD